MSQDNEDNMDPQQIQQAIEKMKQSGMLPFLLQKMGISGRGQAPPMAGQPPQQQRPQTPQQGGQPQPSPQAVPSGAQGDASSGSVTGRLPSPVAQPHDAVRGVASLLMNWKQRKSKGEEAEAANIAQNLMQAMDASNSTDEKVKSDAIATVHEILNDKHSTKVLEKVYKGWLQKSQEAQKPGEKPDPTIQGFEKGIQQHVQKKNQKQQQPQQQAPYRPPTQMPSTMGGYRMPQAGPAQQAVTNQAQTASITTGQDLARAKAGQPTAEQATMQAKYAAEMEEYKSKVQTAALGVQKAQAESQKAQLDLQVKQSEAQLAKQRGETELKIKDSEYNKSLVELDIARNKLAAAKLGPRGGKGQQPSEKLLEGLNFAQQAEAYIESVLKSRGDDGYTKQDVDALGMMLTKAGATSIAKDLPGRWGRHAPSWAGGSGKDDVQEMLKDIRSYEAGLETTINERFPDWKGGSKPKSVTDLQDDVDKEDDSDIVVDPKDMK
jgi:hypothetical protein